MQKGLKLAQICAQPAVKPMGVPTIFSVPGAKNYLLSTFKKAYLTKNATWSFVTTPGAILQSLSTITKVSLRNLTTGEVSLSP
jgi:hypothetical protein